MSIQDEAATCNSRLSIVTSSKHLDSRINRLSRGPSCVMSSPNGQASGSGDSTALPENVVEVPEPHYDFEPQSPFDYHSLDGKDPTICIDNGRMRDGE